MLNGRLGHLSLRTKANAAPSVCLFVCLSAFRRLHSCSAHFALQVARSRAERCASPLPLSDASSHAIAGIYAGAARCRAALRWPPVVTLALHSLGDSVTHLRDHRREEPIDVHGRADAAQPRDPRAVRPEPESKTAKPAGPKVRTTATPNKHGTTPNHAAQRRATRRNAEQRGATPSNAVPLRRRGAAAGRRAWTATADGRRCDSAV